MKRRRFLQGAAAALAAGANRHLLAAPGASAPRYRLALGQWSFHRAFRGEPGSPKRNGLEFPGLAAELGFEGVDYSGLLLGEHYSDSRYLAELNRRASDAGVKNLLILVDLRDPLGARAESARRDAVAKFRPWLEAASTLGCTGIRVNAIGDATLPADEQARLVSDGVSRLLELSGPLSLDVLIENHGEGLNCDGAWIASVVRGVNHARCGTLPDFGNFQKNRARGEFHDRYAGVAAMLPAAKCICAKAHDFDANGDECHTDYARMLRLVADSGYRGWIEVEYEGPGGAPRTPPPERPPAAPLDEREGTIATKRLLRKLLASALHARG
ncbi:MAG: sugar phosphate isomerase/epimerase family protein [Opitutaceae bacterium]|nr:sugar phosphate isomerase/epimerase family protein [Opitutaceae bacterium]